MSPVSTTNTGASRGGDATLNSGAAHLLGLGQTQSSSTVANATFKGLQTSANSSTADTPTGQSPHLTEQLLVVAAVDASTEARATSSGSNFTRGVIQAFKEVKGQPDATIRDFLKAIRADGASGSEAGRVLVYRAVPEATLLAEKLIGPTTTALASGTMATLADQQGKAAPVVSEDRQIYMFLQRPDASGATTLSAFK